MTKLLKSMGDELDAHIKNIAEQTVSDWDEQHGAGDEHGARDDHITSDSPAMVLSSVVLTSFTPTVPWKPKRRSLIGAWGVVRAASGAGQTQVHVIMCARTLTPSMCLVGNAKGFTKMRLRPEARCSLNVAAETTGRCRTRRISTVPTWIVHCTLGGWPMLMRFTHSFKTLAWFKKMASAADLPMRNAQ